MKVGDEQSAEPEVAGAGTEPQPTQQGAADPDRSPADAGPPPDAPPPEVDEATRLRAELAQAHKDVEQSTARLRAVSKAYTELQAEMKAFKERMENRARQDSELQAFDQVRAFFDPVMNLKRSIGSSAHDLGALVQGLQMVETQFMEALHKLGLSEVPGIGSVFDPRLHEALGVQPVSDKEQDGKVLVVHTVGYTVNGRVLQAAQVVIGKYAEPAGEA